jgi:hypothetical protein
VRLAFFVIKSFEYYNNESPRETMLWHSDVLVPMMQTREMTKRWTCYIRLRNNANVLFGFAISQ